MNEIQRNRFVLPFKSVAVALIFSVILGPVGLLYSSTLGGTILIVLCFISISCKFVVAALIFWLASCVWSVMAVNRYNRNILRHF